MGAECRAAWCRRTGLLMLLVGCMWTVAVHPLPIPQYFDVFPVDFDLNITSLASMKAFPAGSPCEDDNGQQRAPGDTWTNGCDRNYCHGGTAKNFTLMYRCRAIGEVENRNTINCREVEYPSQPFPYCCPFIQCDQRNITVTPAPPACRDVSPDNACKIWNEELGGCSASSYLHNITSIYCRLTCQLCT